jgi:ribonucleotide monophosphatase NagD (HAD superfamily)
MEQPLATTSFPDLYKKYQYFIFDVDGVLLTHTTAIKDQLTVLDAMLSNPEVHVFLLTNNGTRTRQQMAGAIKEAGLKHDIDINLIYTTPYLASQVLLS